MQPFLCNLCYKIKSFLFCFCLFSLHTTVVAGLMKIFVDICLVMVDVNRNVFQYWCVNFLPAMLWSRLILRIILFLVRLKERLITDNARLRIRRIRKRFRKNKSWLRIRKPFLCTLKKISFYCDETLAHQDQKRNPKSNIS